MKKIILSILLFSFFVVQMQAEQVEIENLKKSLKTQSGAEKITSLNKVATLYLANKNFEQANKFAQNALSRAQKEGYVEGQAAAYDILGLVFQSKYDYTNAMKQYLAALKIRDMKGDQAGIATSNNHVGEIFYLQDNLPSAEENLVKALNIRKEIKDNPGLAHTHQILGDVYLKKEIYGKAKQNYRHALELLKQQGNLSEASNLAGLLGKIEYDLGDYEGALVYYEMSLDINHSLGNEANIAKDYQNMAMALYAQEAYEEALEENAAALEIWEEQNYDLGKAECLKNFGIIYAEMGETEKAGTFLDQSAALSNKIGKEPGTQQLYKDIAKAFAKIGQQDKAYRYHVIYADTKDILFSQEKNKALLELTTKYQSEFAAEEKQRQIELLQIDQSNSRKIRYFLMALIGVIGLLLANLYASFRRKKQDNELLLSKNEEIHRQKAEIEEKNQNLDELNGKLVHEMAERESIEQSSFARDRFLATMSHEMRTPMNAIIGLTHLLLKENPRPDQAEQLRTLQFSANNMTVFINDVLDFSKIEAGKLNLDNREFVPQTIFDEVKDRFFQPITNKGLAFDYEYDRKIPEKLLGDPARLNQILTNLVSSSLRNTEKGLINLNVQLHEYQKQEIVIFISVTDTGKGLSKQVLDKMFKKYGPGEDDNFEGYDSSDLGLTITKRLVDLQNGLIEVHSDPEKGTSFRLFLPFKFVEEEEVTPKLNHKGEQSYDHLSGNRVLIVEDNKINQLVVAKILRKLGIEAITADNGAEGLEVFNKYHFDLILMDIQMPVMDGYRATGEIRKLSDPSKRDVPIIALTASAFLSEKEKAKLFGMNDHIGKPFGPEELVEKISKALQPKVKSK